MEAQAWSASSTGAAGAGAGTSAASRILSASALSGYLATTGAQTVLEPRRIEAERQPSARLERFLYHMEDGRRSLAAFRLAVTLEGLFERWLLSQGRDVAVQPLRMWGHGDRLQVAGRLQRPTGGGWCVVRLKIEPARDALYLEVEEFLNFGPAPLTLADLPGVRPEALEGGEWAVVRQRIRPLPLLRRVAREEGISIPIQIDPLWLSARLEGTRAWIEGERILLEEGATGEEPGLHDPLLREQGAQLAHWLAIRDWQGLRAALNNMPASGTAFARAFSALVRHCPELTGVELEMARRLAHAGSPSAVSALVMALRRKHDPLRAAWWLARLARLEGEVSPIGWAAGQAAAELEQQELADRVPGWKGADVRWQEARVLGGHLLTAPRADAVRGELLRGEPVRTSSSVLESARLVLGPERGDDPVLDRAQLERIQLDRIHGEGGAKSWAGRLEPAASLQANAALGAQVGAQAGAQASLQAPAQAGAQVGGQVSSHVSIQAMVPGRAVKETPTIPDGAIARVSGPFAFPLTRSQIVGVREQYESREDWRGLLHLLEEALLTADAPTDRLLLHLELAQVKVALGVPSRAVPHFEAILELVPEHTDAVSFLRTHYAREGQHAPRLRLEARLARRLERREACKALLKLADEAELHQLLELSRGLLLEAHELEPADRGLLERLTALLEPLGAWDSLVAAWRRHLPLVAQSKEKVLVGLRIARYLKLQGDLNSADRLYRGVLRSEPEHPEALEGLAEVLEARGEWNEVAELWQRRSRQLRGFERMEAALKLAELHAGVLADPETAEAWFQEAMVEAPKETRALRRIMRHLETKEDFRGLARFLELRWNTADTIADQHELLLYLGDIYLVRLQDQVKARAAFQKAEAFSRANRLSA